YVLGALAADERAEFAAHLSEWAACAAEAYSFAPAVVPVGTAAPHVRPRRPLSIRVWRSGNVWWRGSSRRLDNPSRSLARRWRQRGGQLHNGCSPRRLSPLRSDSA